MLVRIAVLDPLPAFRRGIEAIIDRTGSQVEQPADALAWASRPERRIALLSLLAPADWALLTELTATGEDTVVVAVLDDASIAGYVRAIRTGAVGAVPRDAEPEVLREVVEAAVTGRSVLPIEVLRVLAAQAPAEGPGGPQRHEIEWLRQLARGVSVARLAEQAGYSERMMFRLLRDVYTRLGVGSRTEALIRARDEGWL